MDEVRWVEQYVVDTFAFPFKDNRGTSRMFGYEGGKIENFAFKWNNGSVLSAWNEFYICLAFEFFVTW